MQFYLIVLQPKSGNSKLRCCFKINKIIIFGKKYHYNCNPPPCCMFTGSVN